MSAPPISVVAGIVRAPDEVKLVGSTEFESVLIHVTPERVQLAGTASVIVTAWSGATV